MFAATGPPAARRGARQVGKSALHGVFAVLESVCGSEMKVSPFQQPSWTGLLRITFSRCVPAAVSALYAATHWMNALHAGADGTGFPRHMTWLSALPFHCTRRSRSAKWNHW